MLKLWGHPFSSYTWKAQIALYANDTPFELIAFEPGNAAHAGELSRLHPAAKFPVLLDGDTEVVEATAIIEYLAVHHPGPAPLIPANPVRAVTARMLDRVFDNYVMNSLTRVVTAHIKAPDAPEAEEVAAAKAELRRSYAWLERWLGAKTLPPHVSLVTCAAAPALFYADWVEPIGPGNPRLANLRADLLALPEVSRCVEDARPYRPWFPPGAPDRD